MHNKTNKLFGEWTVELIKKYFKDQEKNSSDKLFIKLTGLDDEMIPSVLEAAKNSFDELNKYYSPIIRTLKPIDQFDEYKCRDYETSTWLRNNTEVGKALIIIMNDNSPEAQSLENIFTINEARIMSKEGFEILYSILVDKYGIFAEDKKTLETFMNLLMKVTDPQLRSLLSFIVHIIDSSEISIIQKIQSHLEHLHLFNDSKLIINTKDGLQQLKRNYNLSHLQNDGGKILSKEDLVNNLYNFIESEDKNQYENEIWDKISPDKFRSVALDFINNQSLQLLSYDFNLISDVFKFKTKRPNISQKINQFIEDLEVTLDNKQNSLLTQTLEAITDGNNPDTIQEFIEEFNDGLASVPKLHKELERIVERQRHSNEYDELSEALLYECFSLLEEAREDNPIENAQFMLSVEDKYISEKALTSIKFHFFNINQKITRIRFDSSSLPEITDKEKDDYITLRIDLIINSKAINKSKFKLNNLNSSHLTSMIEQLKDNNYIPYVENYIGQQSESTNVLKKVEGLVEGYIHSKLEQVESSFTAFSEFIQNYTKIINKSLADGIHSIETLTLEKSIEEILKGVFQSTLLSKHIYKYISLIGTIDSYNCKFNEVGLVEKRTVTLLNPIRLLSYLKRIERVNIELNKWIKSLDSELTGIEEMNDYVMQIYSEISPLSPRYFVVDGDTGQYLLEHQEKMGEGDFAHTSNQNGELRSFDAFSEELLSTIKNYVEVYPYAKDSIDLVFLYCPDSEFVTKSIELIRQKTDIKRIRAIVHTVNKGAQLYDFFNSWINQSEEIIGSNSDFPLVDIQVISERDINKLSNKLISTIRNADLGILVDYFGQSNNINFKLERIQTKDTEDWFSTIYKEPIKKDEAVKRISYVSEHLPKTMQYFYQMQYILETNEMIREDEVFLLRNVISINNNTDNYLINFMHDNFNWSLYIDRYLDKSLLKKVSDKAQIIKYKSTGLSNEYKTIVSSSNYIKKITESKLDYAYYDRLYEKFKLLLKNKHIERDIIIEAVESVKEISGGVVLRAIGPGKFAHELISIYLATQLRPKKEGELLIWSVCDELPWFQRSKRRPDLVGTRIKKIGDIIHIHFEIVELKFISHTILDDERYDAIKQVKAGIELYRSLFSFNSNNPNAELYRKELINYLIDLTTYSVAEAELLKEFQNKSLDHIKVEITSAIDTYVYTSNLYETCQFDENVNGAVTEMLHNEFANNIYNRTFILNKLGINEAIEEDVPVFDSQLNLDSYVNSLKEADKTDDSVSVVKEVVLTENLHDNTTSVTYDGVQRSEKDVFINESSLYPEEVALLKENIVYEDQSQDFTPLLESYKRNLNRNFNQMGISLKVVDSIVGVSVIRLILEGSNGNFYKKVKSSESDMALWLQLSAIPHVSIRNGRINIDINRDKPEIVYFEKFIKIVRSNFSSSDLKGKLVAPLGVGQLNEVISIDLSSPDTPHLLIGGRTGSGKSVTINSIILSLMCLYTPEEVEFIFIDPKKVEFLIYENRQHTRQVVTEIKEAIQILELMIEEMESRYKLFALESVTSIDQYIEVTNTTMPHIVIVFDEFADFMSQEKNLSGQVENMIQRLGAKARAAGIHLLICTQSPKADIVPTNIRNNLPARLALRATDHHASKIILDEEGAETLGGKGEFLAKLDNPNIQRGKSPFLTVNVKRALLKHFINVQPAREEELL